MRTTAVLAIFGSLLVAACAVAGKERYYSPGGPATPMPMVAEGPGDAAVEQMIKDLGADDWRAREQAGRDLTAKGEKALPFMRRALLATDNPEVQRRLSVLVKKMDFDRLVAPKRVTLSAKDRTAKQILDDMSKQTGYKLELGDQLETKYSFEFNNTPFWQAIDAVANKAGFTVYSEYEDDTVRVYNQDVLNPHVAYAGPFRFLATHINSSRNVQLSGISKRGGNERVSEYMNLSFSIQSEPKNPMLGLSQPELLEATDNLGGSLMPPKERNDYRTNYYNRGSRSHNQSMSVNLTRGDRGATSIKSLKGKVRIELLSGTAPEVVVPDPLKVKKQTFAGRTADLEVTSVEEDANTKGAFNVSVTAKSRIPVDPNRGDDYMWANGIQQRIELADDKGNRFFPYGLQSSNHVPGGLQMVMMFGPENRRTGVPSGVKFGPPARLVLNEWITVTHEVTFEFKDIPLP